MPRPPDKWEDGFDEVHAEDREIQTFGVKSLASRTYPRILALVAPFSRSRQQSTDNRAPF